MRLKDRHAIVTGGASGIGRAIALRFGAEGANVTIGDIGPKPLEGGVPTAEVIAAAGGTARYRHCDVSDWDAVDTMVTESVAAFGRLDVFVNNAGYSSDGRLDTTTEEDWDRQMDVNAKGTFFGCKRAVLEMLDQAPVDGIRGRIVNISSQLGMVAVSNKFAYGVSKACSVYMTRQIGVEYGAQGILCNAVAPGRVLSGKPLTDSALNALGYAKMRTALPWLGAPDDVAGAAVYLASDDARFITGHNLVVDGGWTAA